jgi:DNA-binding NarL/FixJ family response regulator
MQHEAMREELLPRLQALADAAAVDCRLAPAETRVYNGMLDGLSNKAIASRLGYSPLTVRKYISSITRKFGVSSRYELMARLFRGRVA